METKKRFTDINKWRDPWFQELSQEAKLLWLFILDDCSPIGLYRYYPSGITFHTGMPKNEIPSLEIFNDPSEKLVKQDHLGENIYLIKDYIDFQYSGKKGNGLSVVNAAHYGYLNEIRDKGLWEYFLIEQSDVIAPKSIKYFYAVDSGKIDNTGKPTKKDIDGLNINLSSIPEDYIYSEYKTTLTNDSPKYVRKEKEKASVKDEGIENQNTFSKEELEELIELLSNEKDTGEIAFQADMERIFNELKGVVALPKSAIINSARRVNQDQPKDKHSTQQLILLLNKQYEVEIVPF